VPFVVYALLYHDIRGKYANFTTHGNTILVNIKSRQARGGESYI